MSSSRSKAASRAGEISTTTGDVSLALAGSDLDLRAETLSGQLNAPAPSSRSPPGRADAPSRSERGADAYTSGRSRAISR